MGLGMLHLLIK